jgi:hypothetical protein
MSEGKILSPAEVAAREAAAFKRGLEAAAAHCEHRWRAFDAKGYSDPEYAQGRSDGLEDAVVAIRALPVPEDRNDQG